MTGKIAFVAGGSSGINLGLAEALGERGAKVAILSRSQDRVDGAVAALQSRGVDSLGFAGDVRHYETVEKALKRTAELLGEIDILISGAAGNFLAQAIGTSANGFRTIVEIDLIGTFNVFRAAYPFLRKPGASLLAITAPQGERAMPLQAGACAAKAGINMLIKVLAMEWGGAGIRVNGISPGPIDGTEGVARLWPDDEARNVLLETLPLERLGRITDVTSAGLFLCSDNASYISGHVLTCDGGYTLTAP